MFSADDTDAETSVGDNSAFCDTDAPAPDEGYLLEALGGDGDVNDGRLLKVSGGDGDVGATSMLGGNCLDCEQTTGAAAGVSGVTSFVVCSDSDDELLSRERLQKNSVACLNSRKHS